MNAAINIWGVVEIIKGENPLQIVKSGPWEELRKQYGKDIFDKK